MAHKSSTVGRLRAETPPPSVERMLQVDAAQQAKRDPLEHFKHDTAWVRLTALLLCRLPFILATAGSLAFVALKLKGVIW